MPDFPTGPGKKILEQAHRAQQNHLDPEFIDSPTEQYLSFRLNEDWYAISVYQLVEILPFQRITRVPSIPDHILGVINLRGEVLSVVDLKRFFGLAQDEPIEDQAIVVVEHGEVRTGLLVDAVEDLVDLALNDVAEEPLLAGQAQRAFFEGAARWGDVLLSIIKLEGLLRAEGMYSPQD
jgi:purine-binding chemotaxis protein CheW